MRLSGFLTLAAPWDKPRETGQGSSLGQRGNEATMRNTSKRSGFCLGLVLLLTACATRPPVPDIDYDPSANFSTLRSYAWQIGGSSIQDHDPRLENPLFDQRLREVVDHRMLLRGFRQDAARPPDFLAAYHLLIEKSAHGYASPPFYGDPYYSPWRFHRPGWYGPYEQDIYWREYENVTLLLDFLDPASGRLIWRGTAKDVTGLSQSAAEQKRDLDAAVDFLLTRFPPWSGGTNQQR